MCFANIFSGQFCSLESVYNHELAHTIDFMSLLFSCTDYSNFLLEVVSIYMQLYTDQQLFEKTKNKKYLKSNLNAMGGIQNYMVNFHELTTINHLLGSDVTIEKIEHLIKTQIDEQEYQNYFANIDNIDVMGDATYLISTLIAMHLLSLDIEYSKRLITEITFNKNSTINDVLKRIGFNLKNPYYACDLFNETCCATSLLIRKR